MRTCNRCGLKAYNTTDLELFVKDSSGRSSHGRLNKCKECRSAERKEKYSKVEKAWRASDNGKTSTKEAKKKYYTSEKGKIQKRGNYGY